MNIFYVDDNPILAAQALVDQHVNKMVSETAQILSNCYSLERMAMADCPRTQKGTPRKHSYPHHPCCKWVQYSMENWEWLFTHGLGLEMERLYRGMEPHFSADFIKWSVDNPPNLPNVPMTPPAQAFGKGNEHLRGDDPVVAYRRYYNEVKWSQENLKKVWTKRKPPVWWEH